MAVNEEIVTGRFYRRLIDEVTKKWQRISYWTKSSDVEFYDGKTAETKLGAIKGITTDLSTTVTGYAADATKVAKLNDSLSGFSFGYTTDGKAGYREVGADTVIPFKAGVQKFTITINASCNAYNTSGNTPAYGTITYTYDNGKWTSSNFSSTTGNSAYIWSQTITGISAAIKVVE